MNFSHIIHNLFISEYIVLYLSIDKHKCIKKVDEIESRYVDFIINEHQIDNFLENVDKSLTLCVVEDRFVTDNLFGFFVVTNDNSEEELIMFYSPILKLDQYFLVDENGRNDRNYKYITRDLFGKEIIYYKSIIMSRIFGNISMEHIEYNGNIYDVEYIIEINDNI